MSVLGFDLNDLLPKSAPAAAPQTSNEPGTSTRTGSMAPRSTSDAALHQLPIPVGEGAAVMAQHLQQLSALAAASATVLLGVRNGSPAAGGASRLAELCGQALPHVIALADHEQDRAAAAAKRVGDLAGANPFKSLDAESQQAKATEGEQAHRWQLEQTRKSLDTMALAVLEVSHAVGRGPQQTKLNGELTMLRFAAPALEWTAPGTPEAARAQARTHEPCASDATNSGDARTENPDQCYLPEQSRGAQRNRLQIALAGVASSFSQAIEKYKKPLQEAIEHDQKVEEEITGAMVDAIVELVTAGVGKVALPAAHSAAAVGAAKAATEAAEAGAHSTVAAARELAIDIMKDAAKDAVRTTLKHPELVSPDTAAPELDHRHRTLAQADEVGRATAGAGRELTHDILKFDDATLEILIAIVESVTVAEITERLEPVMTAFREQIEPLGERSVKLGFPSVRQTVKRAIRVLLPNDQPARYALVDYTSDPLCQRS